MILAIVGLAREARIVGGGDVVALMRGVGAEDYIGKGAEGVISIGIAAGLDSSLKAGDCVIASHVVADKRRFETDERWREALCSRLAARAGAIAGSEGVVASAAEKDRLHAQTSAIAADMESHIAAEAAAEAKIPFAALRVICDEAHESMPPAAVAAMRVDGRIDMGALVRSLLAKPRQLPALMRTARNAELAFGALFRCRSALGSRLGFPDLG